jgi:hypothetical protein
MRDLGQFQYHSDSSKCVIISDHGVFMKTSEDLSGYKHHHHHHEFSLDSETY